jgi:hypothetical protein
MLRWPLSRKRKKPGNESATKRELAVERGRYEAERAERQFARVAQENGLMDRSLERAEGPAQPADQSDPSYFARFQPTCLQRGQRAAVAGFSPQAAPPVASA